MAKALKVKEMFPNLPIHFHDPYTGKVTELTQEFIDKMNFNKTPIAVRIEFDFDADGKLKGLVAANYAHPKNSQLHKLFQKANTDFPGLMPVSYTHLTLPTKRIV